MTASLLDFRRLKQAVSFEQVLSAIGWKPRFVERGDRLLGPCPLHLGDNPRAFAISRSKHLWYCFTRCASGGDIVEFARRLNDGSYSKAARFLAQLAASPLSHELPTANPPSPSRPASCRFRPMTRAIPLSHDCAFLRHKGIRPETAQAFGAGLYSGRGWLKECVAVRLFHSRGQPLGYAGRRLNPQEIQRYGKWKFPPNLPAHQLLFNLHRVRNASPQGVFIVECPWAAMRLYQLRLPAVALMGLRLSPAQLALLEPVQRLVLMLDGDSAGRQAGRWLKRRLGDRARLIELPTGKDPDDLSDQHLLHYQRLLTD